MRAASSDHGLQDRCTGFTAAGTVPESHGVPSSSSVAAHAIEETIGRGRRYIFIDPKNIKIMSRFQQLLAEYSESHQHPTNKRLHWLNVPLIYFSVVGLLWTIELPASLPFFAAMPLNAAMVVVLLVFVYYLNLSFAISIGMLIYSAACLVVCHYVAQINAMALPVASIIIFVVSWAGQFVGHRIEGRKPSFFKDVQFFLIGPAWMMDAIYRAVGIKA